MSFYNETPIKAVRKARRCEGCGTVIEVGNPALKCVGHHDGDFWFSLYHHGCRLAEIELNHVHDNNYDEWDSLSDNMEIDDWPWLIESFPIVAARMNITVERINEEMAERERIQRSWAEFHAKQERVSP